MDTQDVEQCCDASPHGHTGGVAMPLRIAAWTHGRWSNARPVAARGFGTAQPCPTGAAVVGRGSFVGTAKLPRSTSAPPNEQRSTTNDQRSTTNDQRPTTNDQRSTPNAQ